MCILLVQSGHITGLKEGELLQVAVVPHKYEIANGPLHVYLSLQETEQNFNPGKTLQETAPLIGGSRLGHFFPKQDKKKLTF